MESGFYCPECLSELIWLSTTRDNKYWCTNCDVRYTRLTAFVYEQVIAEITSAVENYEETKYYDFTCPNCKSEQRTELNMNLIKGWDTSLNCTNCNERLVLRVPYSAFTK